MSDPIPADLWKAYQPPNFSMNLENKGFTGTIPTEFGYCPHKPIDRVAASSQHCSLHPTPLTIRLSLFAASSRTLPE